MQVLSLLFTNVLVELSDNAMEIIRMIVTIANYLLPTVGAIVAVVFLVKTVIKALEMSKAKSSGDQQGYQHAKEGVIWSVVTTLGCLSIAIVFGFATDIVALVYPEFGEYINGLEQGAEAASLVINSLI